MAIDYRDPRPVYEQIVDHYEKLILTGAMKPDERMPSVRQAATDWSINPNTIQKAFSILEERGYIYAVAGRGNFVAESGRLLQNRQQAQIEEIEKEIREGKELGVKEEEVSRIVEKVYGNISPEAEK
ncbi:MAG: GntR family transcriptional regulator [Eubacteriales bacterium]|jgi:GntR family transcriptional regulator